jgi:hypothetical protein
VFDDLALPASGDGVDASLPERTAPDAAAPDAEVLPADGFVTRADAVEACAVIATCPFLAESVTRSLRVAVAEAVPATPGGSPLPFTPSFSFCVAQLSKTFEPRRPGRDIVATAIRKIAAATSCREAGKNLQLELLAAPDSRCVARPEAGSGAAFCVDGVTMLNCDPLLPFVEHCNAPSGTPSDTCSVIVAPNGGPSYAGCILPEGACPICEGSLATFCGTNAEQNVGEPYRYHIDCNALGLECAVTPGGNEVGCATADHVVRRDNYFFPGSYCANTNLVQSSSTFQSVLDCTSVGGVCAQTNGAAVCTLPTDVCTPFSAGTNTCVGSKIHLCVGGAWADVDCPHGCDTPDGGTGRAVCRAAFAVDGG